MELLYGLASQWGDLIQDLLLNLFVMIKNGIDLNMTQVEWIMTQIWF